jgi:hypothetical protein
LLFIYETPSHSYNIPPFFSCWRPKHCWRTSSLEMGISLVAYPSCLCTSASFPPISNTQWHLATANSHMWHGLNNCGICNICFCQILSVSWSSRVVPLPHQGNQHLHIPLTCVLARSWEVCTCGSSGTSLLCRPSTFVLCVLFSFL